MFLLQTATANPPPPPNFQLRTLPKLAPHIFYIDEASYLQETFFYSSSEPKVQVSFSDGNLSVRRLSHNPGFSMGLSTWRLRHSSKKGP